MKNYLVFSGHIYYPSGGMLDFECDFETEEEAVREATLFISDRGQGWAHVYSLKDKKIVFRK